MLELPSSCLIRVATLLHSPFLISHPSRDQLHVAPTSNFPVGLRGVLAFKLALSGSK